MIQGTYAEVQIDPCQAEVHADISVTEFSTVRIWGQVKNRCGEPVSGVLLKLVQVEERRDGSCQYHGLAHTISDCEGFYQFDVCAKNVHARYRVLAHKSAVGLERVVPFRDPCEP